jgi:hypothetical protein
MTAQNEDFKKQSLISEYFCDLSREEKLLQEVI